MYIPQIQIASQPQTFILLYEKVPLDPSYSISIAHTSQNREAFFRQFLKCEFNNQSYQRLNKNTLRIQAYAEDILGCNYLSFQNRAGKRIYAFITSLNYINENTTEVTYIVDLLQTYYYDITVQPCLVEREHTATDALWQNVQPEGISVNYYETLSQTYSKNFSGWEAVVITTLEEDGSKGGGGSSTDSPDDSTTDSSEGSTGVNRPVGGEGTVRPITIEGTSAIKETGEITTKAPQGTVWQGTDHFIDGVYVGAKVLAFTDTAKYTNFFQGVSDNGTQEGVVSSYMFPAMFDKGASVDVNTGQVSGGVHSLNTSKTLSTTLSPSFGALAGGYTPKNKKLYTHPFHYLLVSSGDDSQDLRFEYFSNPSSITFQETCTILPNPSALSVPVSYAEVNQNNRANYLYMTSLSGFPQCSYVIDSYKAWCAQNANTLEYNRQKIDYDYNKATFNATANGLATAAGLVGNALQLNAGGVVSGLGSVASMATDSYFRQTDYQQAQMAYNANIADRALVPSHASSPANSNALFSLKEKTFRYITMSADYNTIVKADQFFTRYGYACNKIKVPNTSVRPYFTYCKTVDCQIIGSLPASDAAAIQNIYNGGITWWKNSTPALLIGNYADVNNQV